MCDHSDEISFTIAKKFRAHASARRPLQYITMDKLYITNKSNHSFVGKTTETERES